MKPEQRFQDDDIIQELIEKTTEMIDKTYDETEYKRSRIATTVAYEVIKRNTYSAMHALKQVDQLFNAFINVED